MIQRAKDVFPQALIDALLPLGRLGPPCREENVRRLTGKV